MASNRAKRAKRDERAAADAAASAPAPARSSAGVARPRPPIPTATRPLTPDLDVALNGVRNVRTQLDRIAATTGLTTARAPRASKPKFVEPTRPVAPDVAASVRPPAKFARTAAKEPLKLARPGPCKPRPTDAKSKGGGSKAFAPWDGTKFCKT